MLGVLWLQIFAIVLAQHHIFYKVIRKQFAKAFEFQGKQQQKIVHKIKIANWGFLDFSQSYGFITKLLKHLERANASMYRFADHQSAFNGYYYYTMILACEGLFFLVIDGETKDFLRICMISVFVFAGGITSAALMIFARPQVVSSSLIPIIRRCLFLSSFHSNTATQSVFVLKVEEAHAQLVNRMIGVKCASVFIFTNRSNLQTLISFALNVVLIVNLFRNYLLR